MPTTIQTLKFKIRTAIRHATSRQPSRFDLDKIRVSMDAKGEAFATATDGRMLAVSELEYGPLLDKYSRPVPLTDFVSASILSSTPGDEIERSGETWIRGKKQAERADTDRWPQDLVGFIPDPSGEHGEYVWVTLNAEILARFVAAMDSRDHKLRGISFGIRTDQPLSPVLAVASNGSAFGIVMPVMPDGHPSDRFVAFRKRFAEHCRRLGLS